MTGYADAAALPPGAAVLRKPFTLASAVARALSEGPAGRVLSFDRPKKYR